MRRAGFSAAWAVACFVGIASITGCGGGSSGGGSNTTPPQPTISSFGPGQATIEVGSSTSLTATFSNGTAVITPGNLPVTSGTPVTVTPTATTTYTLTVTGGSGTVAATQSTTVTVNPVPTISSFAAGSSTIGAGSSTTLTAVFTGGAGVVTPGNLSITSGTAVTINPTSTTAYTLTVTSPLGTVVTKSATVTVVPAPVITSFSADTNPITSGSSTNLTAVFSGGTGVITPGNLTVVSGTPVSVNPAATTTYTLTVTPSVGAAATRTLTVTVNAGATISSFVANPTQIAAGTSTNLVAVFSGGSGVISPGSLPVTSGSPVSVSPTATTTYTLSVTPTGGGTAITSTTIVTVYPAPAITGFSASPNPLVAGNSTSLTASFSGGTAVITPGNLTVTSGTPVSVSPTLTTTYTLTVTPVLGSSVTQTTTVTVNPSVTVCLSASCSGPQISKQLEGMNLAMWYDVIANKSPILSAFQQAGIAAVRWPGGSNSDIYHWQTNTDCNGGYSVPADTFANFVSNIVVPGNLDLAITANYGSNIACNGPADASEAAAWAAAAVTGGLPIHYMTVGNEVYGSWEYDLHPTAQKHDPTTYASEMVGTSGFYNAIKTASPSTLVGVNVNAASQCCTPTWDPIVLANAKGYYDFVEYHYYAQDPGNENDTYLVQKGAQDFATNLKTLKSELTTAGVPNTPIYVGEIGSVSSNPGKQSWSITQGLYAGQVLGEAMNNGIARLTWWIGFGNCNGNQGNNSGSLYGWQNFGAYNVFADGSGDTGYPNGSPCSYGGPIGTMSPTAEAFNLFQNLAVDGEFPQTTNVVGDTTNVRAYAATHGTGTALMLFNLNQTASQTVSVAFTGSGKTSSTDVKVITYSKSLYDQTNGTTPVWAAPTTTDLGAQTLPLNITLSPWSMSVVIVQ